MVIANAFPPYETAHLHISRLQTVNNDVRIIYCPRCSSAFWSTNYYIEMYLTLGKKLFIKFFLWEQIVQTVGTQTTLALCTLMHLARLTTPTQPFFYFVWNFRLALHIRFETVPTKRTTPIQTPVIDGFRYFTYLCRDSAAQSHCGWQYPLAKPFSFQLVVDDFTPTLFSGELGKSDPLR